MNWQSCHLIEVHHIWQLKPLKPHFLCVVTKQLVHPLTNAKQ